MSLMFTLIKPLMWAELVSIAQIAHMRMLAAQQPMQYCA